MENYMKNNRVEKSSYELSRDDEFFLSEDQQEPLYSYSHYKATYMLFLRKNVMGIYGLPHQDVWVEK
jgi:hypothetical protein